MFISQKFSKEILSFCFRSKELETKANSNFHISCYFISSRAKCSSFSSCNQKRCTWSFFYLFFIFYCFLGIWSFRKGLSEVFVRLKKILLWKGNCRFSLKFYYERYSYCKIILAIHTSSATENKVVQQ